MNKVSKMSLVGRIEENMVRVSCREEEEKREKGAVFSSCEYE